ncbi:hypothetical protein V6Z11_D10G000700 [Gossypium hirsutum]
MHRVFLTIKLLYAYPFLFRASWWPAKLGRSHNLSILIQSTRRLTELVPVNLLRNGVYLF